MARGGNHSNLPSKIYFVEVLNSIYGPYSNRPTSILKKWSATDTKLIILKRDKDNNYIKED